MAGEPQWCLELSLIGPFGDRLAMRIGLGAMTAQEVVRVDPPDALRDFVPSSSLFEQTVRALRRREFRKDLFISEATRLGTLLAERMEDAEGWHGASRVEPAREALARRRF